MIKSAAIFVSHIRRTDIAAGALPLGERLVDFSFITDRSRRAGVCASARHEL